MTEMRLKIKYPLSDPCEEQINDVIQNRKNRGYSIKNIDIENAIHVSHTNIGRWRSGKSNPSFVGLIKLLIYLRVSKTEGNAILSVSPTNLPANRIDCCVFKQLLDQQFFTRPAIPNKNNYIQAIVTFEKLCVSAAIIADLPYQDILDSYGALPDEEIEALNTKPMCHMDFEHPHITDTVSYIVW